MNIKRLPSIFFLALGLILNIPLTAQFPALFFAEDIDGTNGFFIASNASGGDFGREVSNVGDVNGDGVNDMCIGAPLANSNGATYFIYGQSTNYSTIFEGANIDGLNGGILEGLAFGDHFGARIDQAGDFNGDGFGDVIISGLYANPNDNNSSGEIYLLLGRSNMFTFLPELSDFLNPPNGFKITGKDALDNAGSSVAGIGDVNGDGYDDIMIGALGAEEIFPELEDVGEVYIIYGRPQIWQPVLDLNDINGNNGFQFNGIAPNDFAGASGSRVGDINGDGRDDFIIGAPGVNKNADTVQVGECYVFFGKNEDFPASITSAYLDGSNGFTIRGANRRDLIENVTHLGDFNGDGIDDLAVGSTRVNNEDGEAYVIFGKPGAFPPVILLENLDGGNGFTIEAKENFGNGAGIVSAAGDINGDGLADLAIGAPGDPIPFGSSPGEVYIVYGTNSSFGPSISVVDLNGENGFTIKGGDQNDVLGRALAGLGDINGDEIDDLLIGSNAFFPGEPNLGKAYVLYGRSLATSTVEKYTSTDLILAPNPVQDQLTIAIPGQPWQSEGPIKVIDQLGRTYNLPVIQQQDRLMLNTANLATGVYFIQMELADEVLVAKVLKQ